MKINKYAKYNISDKSKYFFKCFVYITVLYISQIEEKIEKT